MAISHPPRYVCVHGHFYQPPRENPWLEAIEFQESAEPYHDWNERITAECYRPNSAARIQSSDGHIIGIINNYARMSFNFGPTLLSWMETHSPASYKAILQADKESISRFGGHGSAIAQVYNHIIMPLANHRDKESQVVWGIRDFEYRFGRKPEGMWLAETAVDTDTLEILAEHGITYTILAPRQAKAIRPIAANSKAVPNAGWEDVTGARVDPARAYLCNLPSGRSIALFFYDGPISQAIAFEGILSSGEQFAERLMSGFSASRDYPQLLHVATDGETYGHHHKFGDMALAYALHHIEANDLAILTNYGQFLELHPPQWEARIVEESSWSCSHGVQRWASDCGCSSGMHPGWSQQWRSPLRHALNWLRDSINPVFESRASEFFSDPWQARNAYVDVILQQSKEARKQFLDAHAKPGLTLEQETMALQLMEMQRQMMLMFTSCGWFFDELSGIETVQIMQYASRAIQLAHQCLGQNLEAGFIRELSPAVSNLPDNVDGTHIYNHYVRPAKVDLVRVGAHYAVISLFQAEAARECIYAFTIERDSWNVATSGQARLATGRARVTSDVTWESSEVTFCVLHLGHHNIMAGVRGPVTNAHYEEFCTRINEAFRKSDLPQAIRHLDQEFFGLSFTLQALFKDERQMILKEILRGNLQQAEASLRHIFENNASLMHFMSSVGVPQPDILQATGRFVIGTAIRRILEENVPDPDALAKLIEDGIHWNLSFHGQGLEVALNDAIELKAAELLNQTHEINALKSLIAMADLGVYLPSVNFWLAQNVIFQLMSNRYPENRDLAEQGDEKALHWTELYQTLGEKLKVKIEDRPSLAAASHLKG